MEAFAENVAARQAGDAIMTRYRWMRATFRLVLLLSSCAASGVRADDIYTCGRAPFFIENFETESIASRELKSFRWTAHTPWNGDFGDAVFADPGPNGPFVVTDGVLKIAATKGSDGKWRSGLISAADYTGAGRGLQYGYFESRMKLPPGPGTWPAFWLSSLRPAGSTGPSIEIDIIEYYGHDTSAFQSAVHVWSDDPTQIRHVTQKISVPPGSLTDQYHTYGVLVASDAITFYLDRRAIWQTDTPRDLTLPLFPLVNLALGSGFPIVDTPNPSTLNVDYVRVYSLDKAARSGRCAPHDFNGDIQSDILWRNTSGETGIWFMNGAAISAAASYGFIPNNWSVVGQRDFDGDGKSDLLWLSSMGDIGFWFIDGQTITSTAAGNVGTAWSVVGTADFNGDGCADILWRSRSGETGIWFMNGGTVTSVVSFGNVGTTWSVTGTGDFNGDGKADILWRSTSNDIGIWIMNGDKIASLGSFGNVGLTWVVAGTGDFDGDGKADILWCNTSNDVGIWFMNGASTASVAGLGNVGPRWSIASVGDYNGDGKSDILWRSASHDIGIWFMNAASVILSPILGNVGPTWMVQNAASN